MITDLQAWSAELVLNSSFIPDFGSLNLLRQAETRFDRYVELLEMVEGNEPPEILHTMANSIRMEDDCGAYQVTIDTFCKFMGNEYLNAFIEVLAKVDFRRSDLASDMVIKMSQIEIGESTTFLQALENEISNCKSSAAGHCIQIINKEKFKNTLNHAKPQLKLVVG
ncbi:MAG: hypothetical protein D6B28_01165 [Gammaproteobacteria bacterium]|nr:MAG: hypothetical protein D6B28_01165 [Gammaproteobacteria bacterium]